MFELITDGRERPLRERSPMSKVVAIVVHVVLIIVLLVVPLLRLTDVLPLVPAMMAFVATAPAPQPPPPPPPAPAPMPDRAKAAAPQPVKTAGEFAAPIEAPSEIRPEPPGRGVEGFDGVEGGVVGGVAGGVVGGIVEGIVSPAPPPLQPPPPPAPRVVRIGGQITAPALVHRVEPEYPDLARAAQLSGLVILEASVDTEGCVESVKVLRSRHKLLDEASIVALKQWRYSPLVLNSVPTPFVLTVTFTFRVE